MKFTEQQIAEALNLLEEAKFGLLAENYLIRVGQARSYYYQLADLLEKLSRLCKLFPEKLEQLKKEHEKTKLELAQEMLKTSLLLKENDPSSISLSGNPFPI